MMNPREAVRDQISTVKLSDFIIKREITPRLSRSMNARTKANDCIVAERAVKTSFSSTVIRKGEAK